jgi:uncharacterized DUF497 family protein
MKTKFEWDAAKAVSNLTKHGVSFQTAVRVFADPHLCMAQDRFENGEFRWQSIGMVDGCLVILVAHTLGEDEAGSELIRILSARRAEPKERKRY